MTEGIPHHGPVQFGLTGAVDENGQSVPGAWCFEQVFPVESRDDIPENLMLRFGVALNDGQEVQVLVAPEIDLIGLFNDRHDV